jgi:hypothetical protein
MKILLILCLLTSTAYGGTTTRWWYHYTYPKGHCPRVIVVPNNYYRKPKPRKRTTYFTPRLQAVKRPMGAVPMPSYSEPLEILNPYVDQ